MAALRAPKPQAKTQAKPQAKAKTPTTYTLLTHVHPLKPKQSWSILKYVARTLFDKIHAYLYWLLYIWAAFRVYAFLDQPILVFELYTVLFLTFKR